MHATASITSGGGVLKNPPTLEVLEGVSGGVRWAADVLLEKLCLQNSKEAAQNEQ